MDTNDTTAEHMTRSFLARLEELRHCLVAETNIERLLESSSVRGSRERSLALTKIDEAMMWLREDLHAITQTRPTLPPFSDPAP